MSEHLNIFDHSISVVAFEKDGIKYSATYAWGTQVDYDKIVILIGSQSETGNALAVDQVMGVSILNEEQADIANQLGSSHSTKTNKLANITYTASENGAITINNATRQMIVKVIDIYHLPQIEEDLLVYGEILSVVTTDKPFLHIEKM